MTTQACLAKKLREWGTLRKCQSVENAKRLQGKPFDLAKCDTTFAKNVARFDQQAAKAAIACRYAVNGDGTVIDLETGLQWEQKTDDGSVHDKDNVYTWSTAAGGPPNGTAYGTFLRTLDAGTSSDGGNTVTGCFAGFCDWRLPSVVELKSIALPGCSGSPCIDQAAFGPTNGTLQWTDTILLPGIPFVVSFQDGAVGACSFFCATDESLSVRAVRSGL